MMGEKWDDKWMMMGEKWDDNWDDTGIVYGNMNGILVPFYSRGTRFRTWLGNPGISWEAIP